MFAGSIYGVRRADEREFRDVGQTKYTVAHRRMTRFRAAIRGRKTPFYDWLRKFDDREDLYFESLELIVGGPEELNAAEARWVASLRGDGHRLLNLTDGGDGVRGYIWTAEQRQAARERGRGRAGVSRPGPDHPMWGRTHTDEQQAKWSEGRKGTNTGASNPNFDKSASDETRAKMSAVRKGRPMPFSVRNAHTRHHTNKGTFNETCRHCQDDARTNYQPKVDNNDE